MYFFSHWVMKLKAETAAKLVSNLVNQIIAASQKRNGMGNA